LLVAVVEVLQAVVVVLVVTEQVLALLAVEQVLNRNLAFYKAQITQSPLVLVAQLRYRDPIPFLETLPLPVVGVAAHSIKMGLQAEAVVVVVALTTAWGATQLVELEQHHKV
jgi:hypothetical protein